MSFDFKSPLMTLWRDGVEVSRHNSRIEAVERMLNEGPGEYVLKTPDQTYVIPAWADIEPPVVEPVPEPVPEPEPTPEPEPEPVPEPEPPVVVDPPVAGIPLNYLGGFRLKAGTVGASRPAFNEGVIGVTDQGTVWIAGHVQHFAYGEYQIPAPSKGAVADLPIAENVTPFKKLNPAPWADNARIMGFREIGESLFLTTQEYYDGGADNQNSLAIDNNGIQSGYFTVSGNARAAGWMQPIPEEWQERLGGTYLMGAASNLAIDGRLSIGPSLWVWDGNAGNVSSRRLLDFPLNHAMGPTGNEERGNPLWNQLSHAYTGFIKGDQYIVIGSTGGLESGIGYKIMQSNGRVSAGPAAYDVSDYYSYYWIFNLQDILDAENPYDPRPADYGKLPIPGIDGADYHAGKLYAVDKNGDWEQSQYEGQPVIKVYEVQ